jgi:hypothetical protein
MFLSPFKNVVFGPDIQKALEVSFRFYRTTSLGAGGTNRQQTQITAAPRSHLDTEQSS